MTHKNEHHLNIIYTGDDYDLIFAWRESSGKKDTHDFAAYCKALILAHAKTDMDFLRRKHGGNNDSDN